MSRRPNGTAEGVRRDLTLVHDSLSRTGALSKVLRLRSHNAYSIGAFAIDWMVVVAAVFLVHLNGWFILPAIITIGIRQRGLSNLIHDASHGNLFKSRQLNDSLTDFLAAYSMFETTCHYRKRHLNHHKFLGSPSKDPDLEAHKLYGYDDHSPNRGGVSVLLRLVLNWRSVADSVLGGWTELTNSERLKVIVWWLMLTGFLCLLSTQFAITFLVLWFGARISTYHVVRVVAEFLDHTGLAPEGILSFTRNIPSPGFLKFVFHPHSDNYHLAHHLLPGVPHYHLSSANRLLQESGVLRTAEECDGYFLGKHPALKSWRYGATNV